jgi:hypothetical protein
MECGNCGVGCTDPVGLFGWLGGGAESKWRCMSVFLSSPTPRVTAMGVMPVLRRFEGVFKLGLRVGRGQMYWPDGSW